MNITNHRTRREDLDLLMRAAGELAARRIAGSLSCGPHLPKSAPPDPVSFEGDPGWRTSLVLIVESNDVLQYIWGKLVGRHRLAPALSPSKTAEGLVGGVASATLLGALLYRITPFKPWQAALMAFLVCLMGYSAGW